MAQAQSDFRSVEWGMSILEVKQKETLLLSSEGESLIGHRDGQDFYSGYDLKYENASISGLPCK